MLSATLEYAFVFYYYHVGSLCCTIQHLFIKGGRARYYVHGSP